MFEGYDLEMQEILSTTNKRLFKEVFPISIEQQNESLLKDIYVENIEYYKNSSCLMIYTKLDSNITLDFVEELENKVTNLMGVKYSEIIDKCNHNKPNAQEVIQKYKEKIIRLVNKRVVITKSMIAGSEWKVIKNEVLIYLKSTGSSFLKLKSCDKIIEKFLTRNLGVNFKVQFVDKFEAQEDSNEEYIKFKEAAEKKLLSEVISEVKKEELPKTGSSSHKESSSNANSEIIMGRAIKDEIIKIKEINDDVQRAAIQGKILTVDSREIRDDKQLVSFDIYDRTNSITVKAFLAKEKYNDVFPRLKPDIWVKVRGNIQYDKYSKEITLMALDIIETSKPAVKKDKAKNKRVELHLHTQMSSMDAVNSAEDLIKRAADWGHKAIAITDHGVVQSYPEAYTTGKKNNIKILYGIECYLVDDKEPIIKNAIDYSLDGEYVVVDIETTGLSSQKDKIIEFGAVKIRNSEVIERYNTLVNPGISIPYNIVKLTGIRDDMVKDSPKLEEVLSEFVAFIGNAPIIAHNASFDMGFIYRATREHNIKLDNPIVDTLTLSRILLPYLERHKLGVLAKHFNIEVKNAHRADDDALVTGRLWLELVKMLKEKEIASLNMIDNKLIGQIDIKNSKTYHAIIMVKNQEGLKNLYKIVSESHMKYFYKKPRVPKSLYTKYKEGLMIGSACEAGELYSAILNKKKADEIKQIVRFYDYLEVQPLGNNEFMIRNGQATEQDLIDINKKIIELGDKYKKLVVATCDVHFMDESDEVFRRILMAGQGFDDADKQAPLYLRTTEEMLKEFKYLDDQKAYEIVVTNTNLIADMIEDEVVPIPQKTFPPKIEGAEEEIERLALGKAKEIYGDPLPEIVQQRLDKELNSIIKNGFSVMYIIAQKLVSKSLSDGYLVGSRGSVGSSFVATMSGITEVNALPAHYVCKNCKYSEFPGGKYDCGVDMPDKDCPNCGQRLQKDGYDIPFETFLGFDGDKEPDIDLNFSGDYQPRAHKYVEKLFGEGHVFRAGTIATVADKTAYGFVKNYLADRNIQVFNAEVNRLVKGCTGIKRTTGQHPGGVMIVPQDNEVYEFCPIQRPADDTSSGIITTHFDYHSIHGTLLKLDILGHDDPTVIRMLEDLTRVDAREIPIDDKETMSIFTGTKALGIEPQDISSEVGSFAIPEFGTKFVRQMLVDTKPTTFSELVKISGLSHGTDVWLNNAQDLVRARTAKLSEVICTRDDIMLDLIKYGLEPKQSFKIMEDVRKGKGLKPEYEEAMRANNVPEWYIESCNKIKYMFPKAHACAYVMMAFRIAYFKVHYPKAFYVAYFTVRADDFDAELMTSGPGKVKESIKELETKGNTLSVKEKSILTILEVANEMYARGIKFLPIDLYTSDPTKFLIEDGGIRPPLNSLQGLGTVAAQSLAEVRKHETFLSKDEVRIKAKVSKSVIEMLDKCGCLEGLPDSNQLSLF